MDDAPPPSLDPLVISPSDRFTRRSGSILISGVQALVRLMILQAERDRLSGLSTGGFVSGYRGSPLGTLDMAFQSAGSLIEECGIVVRPAVNEELAATAIAGSQQIDGGGATLVQGVFALWYGKGPGLDRASDAIRHGNYQGASPRGGVVLAVGDDHLAKSSSIVCYSDEMVAGLKVPLFYPADAREIVEYGLHAFALSRHTGSWTALKVINEVADATRAVPADELDDAWVLPEIEGSPGSMHGRWPEMPLEQELRQVERRLPAVADYVHANGLDRIVLKGNTARIGLIAAGKSWHDLREALDLLDLTDESLTVLGVALYKPAMTWPLEERRLAEFADGLEAILVVEEKDEFIERQVKSILYHSAGQPSVWGKRGRDGAALLPATGDLAPESIALALEDVLSPLDDGERLRQAAGRVRAGREDQLALAVPPAVRKPFFCSGCPHNMSTVVPEGSRAIAGIGCHGLAAYNNSRTSTFAQMGGEGIHWMGMAPFTREPHVFANMGDGTYFHSGLLAIRQAVAADLTLTYKLLFNSAVAMTGGQAVDGELDVAQLADQLMAEGVATIAVLTDDPGRYARDKLRERVLLIDHRDKLAEVQARLRLTKGVSVIIYDQTCATEKRRMWKRGKRVKPDYSIFINEAVCEACGDCSIKSNCLSVEPVDTALGTKRRINQSSCNKDTSCLSGFCPSFVTVHDAQPRTSSGSSSAGQAPLREPISRACTAHERVLIAGVGGTGVVTIGALLSMSAHLEGRSVAVLDQIGMAQKGGAVTSHLHVATDPIHALRIVPRHADLILVCDQIVGNSRDVMAAINPGHTKVIVNSDVSITGDFTQNGTAVADGESLARRLAERAGAANLVSFPFSQLAEKLLADAIASNLMMLGFAYQEGWAGLDRESFIRAVGINGVKIDANLAAFDWGRRLSIDPASVLAGAGLPRRATRPKDIDSLVADFERRLTDYQDGAYATRFRRTIDRVRAAETSASGEGSVARAAATSLFRLMAYKDEYEVARLYTDGGFRRMLAEEFGGYSKLSFHMAPPVLARQDKVTGLPAKRRFGGWWIAILALLARGKRLRGTMFDPFGYLGERRAERALIVEFEQVMDRLIAGLTPTTLPEAARIAALATEIRGFGPIKQSAIDRYHSRLEVLMRGYERKGDTQGRVPAQRALDLA